MCMYTVCMYLFRRVSTSLNVVTLIKIGIPGRILVCSTAKSRPCALSREPRIASQHDSRIPQIIYT